MTYSLGPTDATLADYRDRTIDRTTEGSTCSLCGHLRLFNADGCVHCWHRDRRRFWRTLVGVLLVCALALGAAVLIEPIPEPRTVSNDNHRY